MHLVGASDRDHRGPMIAWMRPATIKSTGIGITQMTAVAAPRWRRSRSVGERRQGRIADDAAQNDGTTAGKSRWSRPSGPWTSSSRTKGSHRLLRATDGTKVQTRGNDGHHEREQDDRQHPEQDRPSAVAEIQVQKTVDGIAPIDPSLYGIAKGEKGHDDRSSAGATRDETELGSGTDVGRAEGEMAQHDQRPSDRADNHFQRHWPSATKDGVDFSLERNHDEVILCRPHRFTDEAPRHRPGAPILPHARISRIGSTGSTPTSF